MAKDPSVKNKLKIGEAAKTLGVSVDTLRRWEASGKIKTTRTAGGTRLYSNFVKIGDAAKTLGVSIDTLRRWEKAGKIETVRTPGGTRLYSLDQLQPIKPPPSVTLTPVKSDHSPLNPPPTIDELLAKKEKPNYSFSNPDLLETIKPPPEEEIYQDFENLAEEQNEANKIYAKIYAKRFLASFFTEIRSSRLSQGLTALLLIIMVTVSSALVLRAKLQTSGEIVQLGSDNVLAATSSKDKFLGINTDAVIKGALAVDGQGFVTGNLSTEGDLEASGSANIKDSLTVGRSTTLRGATTLSSTLRVGGLSTLTGGLTTPGKISLTGNSDETLLIKPSSDPSSATKLFVIQNSGGTEKFSINSSGNTSVSGTLAVTGASTLTGAVTISDTTDSSSKTTGAAIVSGGLGVAKKVYVGSTLNVSGDTTLSSSLAVSGSTTFDSSTTTGGQAKFTTNPSSTDFSKASIYINPSSTDTNDTAWSVAIDGTLKAQLDYEGDLAVGYSSTTDLNLSVPFAVYNHGTTQVASIDTSGNLTLAGTLAVTGSTTFSEDITIQNATPSLFLTDSTSGEEDFSINTDGSIFTIRNETDSRNDISISAAGAVTINGASAGEGTSSLTLTSGDLTITDGDLTLSSGEIAATSDDATGTAFSFTGVSTTGTSLGVISNSLTTGTALSISSTSTAGGASGNSKLLDLSRSGANSNSSHTAYGVYSSVTNTGTTSTNIAGYFAASGASTNWAGYFAGNVTVTAGSDIFTQGSGSDIGSSSTRFATGYFDTIDATNIAGTVTGGSTTSSSWTINSDNATADTEDAFLTFERGSSTPNATIWWNSTDDRIQTNSSFFILGDSTNTSTSATTAPLFAVQTYNAHTTGDLVDITGTYTPTAGGTQSAIDINITNSPSTSANTLRVLDIGLTDSGSLANTVYGAYIDVTTANSSDTTYAAYFAGGNVGIGDSSPAALFTVGSGDIFQIASTGLITNSPTTTGTLIDYNLETEWTTGTLLDADFGSATSLSGDVTGIDLDFYTNVTPGAGRNITMFKGALPSLTQTSASTSVYKGFEISSGGSEALVQNTASGTIIWAGVNINIPSITQTTGSVTASGLRVLPNSITTAGTVNGFIFDANSNPASITTAGTMNGVNITPPSSGVGAGTFNAINIGGLTAGAGTEYAITIGAGWDSDINATTSLEIAIGGTNELVLDGTSLSPATSDGLALGTSSLMWSDLFLASGAVINFNNGDVTVTHSANTITVAGGNIDLGANDITTIGALTIAPDATGTIVDFALETEWTTGTLINADYASATTLTGAVTGLSLNFNSNVTGVQSTNLTGVNVQTPTLTQSDNATATYTGYNMSAAGALTTSGGNGATVVWSGARITMPNITQGASTTIVSSGFRAANGTITTGGTQYGFYVEATGVGAGTLTGLNIDGITAGAGTEYAINIGAGWDQDINATTSLELAIGGTGEITLTSSAFSPATSDSNALGTTSLMWSDLFLASGSVINLNNGDVTLTHGTNSLTQAGGDLVINYSSATALNIQDGSGNNTHTLGSATGVVFNENSADLDFRIESDGNANAFVVDAGNNAIGFFTAPPDNTVGVLLQATLSFSGASGYMGMFIDPTFTAAANQDAYGAAFRGNFTEAASGTHALMATARFLAPDITNAAATTTTAATIYVAGAPSGGTNNYSIFVDAGDVRFDGNILIPTDESFIGLSASAGRIEFDDTTTDEINILSAKLGVNNQSPATTFSVYNASTVSQSSTLNSEFVGFYTDSDIGFTHSKASSDAGAAPFMEFYKAKGTHGSKSANTTSGDTIGYFNFRSYDSGGTYVNAAQIMVEVDGTGGTNDMPGRIVFKTTADGSTSVTERLRLTSTGAAQFTSAVETGTTTSSALSVAANSLTTGTGIYTATSSLTTGKLAHLVSTSTAGTGSDSKYLLYLDSSGANSNATHTAYGIYSTVTNSGTTGTNVAGFFTTSTATTQYALQTGNLTAASSGTAYGLNIGTSAGATSATFGAINTGAISGAGTTSYGINLGANSSTATTNYGINIGAISGAGTTNYGAFIGAVSGATSNYGIFFNNAPAQGSIATASNTAFSIVPGGTGAVQITSGVTTGTTTSSALSVAANSVTTGTALNISATGLTSGNLIATTNKAQSSSPTSTSLTLNDRDLNIGGHTDRVTLSNITATFVYDTTKDPDGGAWTDDAKARTSSWYNETADATGAACTLDTDDRCGQKPFPKKAVIIATTTKLYIYDSKDNTLWMDFRKGATTTEQMIGPTSNSTGSSVFAMDGKIYFANNGSVGGLYVIDFKTDRAYKYNATDDYFGDKNIANRNSTVAWFSSNSSPIGNTTVNDVHAAIINGKSYAVVGTDDGMSVIHENDRVVYDYSDASSDDYNSVWIDKGGNLWGLNETKSQLEKWTKVIFDTADDAAGTPNVVWDESGVNAVAGPYLWTSAPTINAATPDALFIMENSSFIDGKSPVVFVGNNAGMTRIDTKENDETHGSAKYYTTSKITEAMVGDIRGMWNFNESSGNASDSSVKANTLTTNGTVTYSASAVRNTGVTLDGSSAYFSRAYDADFDFGNNSFAVSSWFKHNTASALEYLIARHSTTNGGGFKLWMDDSGDMCFGIDDDTTWGPDDQVCTSGVDFDDNAWHHVVAVKNGINWIKLYVDGVEVASNTALTYMAASSSGMTSTNALLRIGTDTPTAGNYWTGSVDEVMITRELITPEQIRYIYQSGNGALQNHTANRVGSVTADTYQQLQGSNVVQAVTGANTGNTNQFVYVGTTSGLSVISNKTDTLIDMYDTTVNNVDDTNTSARASANTKSVSVSGPVASTNTRLDNQSTMAIGTASEFWAQTNNVSVQEGLASALSPTQLKENLTLTNSLNLQNASFNLTGINDPITGSPVNTLSIASTGDITTKGDLIFDSKKTYVYNTDQELQGLTADFWDSSYIYDTSTDSDGGAWTEDPRVRNTSWYNETLNTTTRGKTKAFPKVAIIAITRFGMAILDAKDHSVWMVFNGSSDNTKMLQHSGSGLHHVYAKNGVIYVSGGGTVNRVDFKNDTGEIINSTGWRRFSGTISGRNTAGSFTTIDSGVTFPAVTFTYSIHANVVNGKTYVAVGHSGDANGAVALINETDHTKANFGVVTSAVDANSAWITSDGTLYYSYQAKTLKVNYNAHLVASGTNNKKADIIYGYNSATNYGVITNGGSSDATVGSLTFTAGPAPRSAATISNVKVTEKTSTVDGKSNTIWFMYDNGDQTISGAGRIDEKRGDETNGSAKYYNSTLISDEMVGNISAMWPLALDTTNGDLEDMSPQANTLTASNIDSDDAASGVRGKGADFNGTDENLSIAAASDADFDFNGSEVFSISAWVKPSSIPATTTDKVGVITKWDATSTLRGYRIYLENDDTDSTGNFKVEIYDESADQSITATTANDTVSASTWYHIIMTFNGGTAGAADDLKLYVNGYLADGNDENASFLGLEDIAADFVIADYDATDTEATNDPFAGVIDEVMVTAETLSASQVKQIYRTGFLALQNHTASRVSSITADNYQRLHPTAMVHYGNDAFDVSDRGDYFAIANQNHYSFAVTTFINTSSDSIAKIYDPNSNDRDDRGRLLDFNNANPDTISVSGSLLSEEGNSSKPGFFVMGQKQSSAPNGALWMETRGVDLKRFMANSYNPFGTSMTQSNLIVDNRFSVTTQRSTQLDNLTYGSTLEPLIAEIFAIDPNGGPDTGIVKILNNSTGIDGSTTTNANVAGLFVSTGDSDTISLLVRNTSTGIDMADVGTAGAQADPGVLTVEGAGSDTSAYNLITAYNSTTRSDAAAVFRVRADGTVYGEAAFQTSGADYAEYFYTLDTSIEAGDLVSINSPVASESAILKTNNKYDQKILGIVSTKPGFVGNNPNGKHENDPNFKTVALAGRVPTKVSSENGPIKKGDYLTSSSIPGVAMKATRPGQVVGKALEEFIPNCQADEGQFCQGKILVFVNVSFADPQNALANLVLDTDGSLAVPKFKTTSLTLGPINEAVLGTSTSHPDLVTGSIQIDSDSSAGTAETQVYTQSTAIDVASKLKVIDILDEKLATQSAVLADTQATVASQSAALAQTQSATSTLAQELASASARIAESKSELDMLKLKLEAPESLIATDSATIAEVKVEHLEASEIFKSLGETFLANTTILGNLVVDGTLSIDRGSEINVIGLADVKDSGSSGSSGRLYLQRNALSQSLDILAGRFIFDKNGKLTVAGEVQAKQFSVTSGESAGVGLIAAGQTEVTITNPYVKLDSIIIITPETLISQTISVADKKTGESFKAKISNAESKDITFSYLIIGQGEKISSN